MDFLGELVWTAYIYMIKPKAASGKFKYSSVFKGRGE